MNKFRTFNGKRYMKLPHRYNLKKAAQAEAKKGRAWGHLTRVITEDKAYYVYIKYQ